jgi:hypothetical protein
MACGGHVYWRIWTKWAIFIDDLPRMLPTKFWFIWQSGFRELFLEINQSETRIACGGHVCQRIGTKLAIFIKDFPRMLPTTFQFTWPSVFRGEDFFRNQPIRNKNCLWWPCLLTDRDKMSNLYRGHAIDASYQVSLHMVKRFQRRRLKKNRSIRNKNCLWWPCLLMNWDNMSNF